MCPSHHPPVFISPSRINEHKTMKASTQTKWDMFLQLLPATVADSDALLATGLQRASHCHNATPPRTTSHSQKFCFCFFQINRWQN